jgi:hypothetical protein
MGSEEKQTDAYPTEFTTSFNPHPYGFEMTQLTATLVSINHTRLPIPDSRIYKTVAY